MCWWGLTFDQTLAAVDRIVAGGWSRGEIPPLWDGRAAERIADVVESFVGGSR